MKNKTDRDGILFFSSAVDITLEEDSHRPLSPLISVDFFEMNRSGSADAGWVVRRCPASRGLQLPPHGLRGRTCRRQHSADAGEPGRPRGERPTSSENAV